MELIFILTYDCNFRCKYCDINKKNINISENIIKQSLLFLEKNNFSIEKVKFFGGEPLLKQEYIENIVKSFPKQYNPQFFVTTNTTLITPEFIKFSQENNISVTFSIDGDDSTISQNRLTKDGKSLSYLIIENTRKYSDFVKINQVITSINSHNFFSNFEFLYSLGVRKFNFLPEYYSEWTKKGLINLKKGFDEILSFRLKGNNFEVVNLDNFSETSFFNLGLVVDVDGSLYGTNLILSGKFEKYKKDLRIGDVFNGITLDIYNNESVKEYIVLIGKFLNMEYNQTILKSVKYVDLILNDFCNLWNTKD